MFSRTAAHALKSTEQDDRRVQQSDAHVMYNCVPAGHKSDVGTRRDGNIHAQRHSPSVAFVRVRIHNPCSSPPYIHICAAQSPVFDSCSSLSYGAHCLQRV